MIVILTGHYKNVGDHLIGYRARILLSTYVDNDILELDRSQKLDDYLDVINSSRALILCGGPAYQENIYPGVYPLVDDLSKIKVPIIPFGLGWSGSPRKSEDFVFSEKAKNFLRSIHEKIQFSSCRDDTTKSILQSNGVMNVIMTGCPVWYDLESMDKIFEPLREVKKVVFTTPAGYAILPQVVRMLKLVKNKYPKAEIYCTFHRGIYPDKDTKMLHGFGYMAMALMAKIFGMKVLDVSSKLEKIDFYKNCDIHIGYRVHAHLYFLSKRKPSILINEDGRGLGMVQTMGLPIFYKHDKNLINNIGRKIDEYNRTNYKEFEKLKSFFDLKFLDMKKFLESIE